MDVINQENSALRVLCYWFLPWETRTGKILQCRLGLIYPKAECTEETVQALAATVPVTPKEWVQ